MTNRNVPIPTFTGPVPTPWRRATAQEIHLAELTRRYKEGLQNPRAASGEEMRYLRQKLESLGADVESIRKEAFMATGEAPGAPRTGGGHRGSAKESKPCWCGCGGMATGRGSKFIQGHDSKLKSWLRKVESGEVVLEEVPNFRWLKENVLPQLPRCTRCGAYFVAQKGELGPYCQQVVQEESDLALGVASPRPARRVTVLPPAAAEGSGGDEEDTEDISLEESGFGHDGGDDDDGDWD